MVADLETVRDRESRIRRYVKDLRGFADISEIDFLANTERQYAVLHALHLAIEACVDIATHIAAADDLGIATTYAEAFSRLEKAKLVEPALAEDLKRMARFRNRIVHFYADVDAREVYRIVRERLDDFDRYLEAVERYLTG